MNSQLYTAASGMLVEQRRLELISNNLANTSTPAYRSQRAFSTVYQRFGPEAADGIRAANAGVALAGTYEVPGPGPLRDTGRALDLALDADQFLAVQTPAGRRYTRAGALDVTSTGALIDAMGNPVLGASGKPITGVVPGAIVTADARLVNEESEIGRLLVMRDPKHVLRPEGNNLLATDGSDAALAKVTDPSVKPGWLEGSGTNALGELVELIQAQRSFETYQKIVSTTMNETNRKTVNDIAG
jgi:flagellar basal-body rod protein FlgF